MEAVWNVLRGLLGLSVILAIAWALSSDRGRISWRLVGVGLLLQLLLAVFILKGDDLGHLFAPLGWPKAFFSWVSSFFVLILRFTTEGARFLFGNLALSPGQEGSMGAFFAFQVLPTIIFFSALMSVLYHLGLMQRLVQAMAWVMTRLMGTSGAESLSVTANIFVGQTEAPLVIRPYLKGMTRSELLAVMTGGMATIAGGVMAAYIQMLGDSFARARGLGLEAARLLFAEQLLGASVMAAPAALVLAKILIPETSTPETAGIVRAQVERTSQNLIDAAARGASDGLKLAANVGAMLIAFIALIALLNYALEWAGGLVGLELSLQRLLGWILAPIGWLIGVPWADAMQFGSLLGTKIVLNEFVAYLGLADAIQTGQLAEKSIVMSTFALCGFANFSSIAIQLGGIGPLIPDRASELAQLGLRAVLAGTLANMMTATIAGALIG
ncbi:MAG: NupC/NupG family nucleoside CNT transporter [Bacteroidetes bacterium]|nr:NupC/NupG family nucleoside CNT transporter [Rhodothermia bacterium]MCS7155895.1 NupC/NupG family nucleoside CNT transporter [Bacteroidota bacterium]MCX7906004.1 NupC/NupG family nucleoside CNT transporter [Bacteroidota bacterium]MDW8138132.1 nucleoside transporter C-terminal domain-containing protein [Bacteroidota bacterium]MDW8285816.1 nucleoside transporter C-terminal domain-containing protein [Bacteroidota bacterium]